MRLVQYHTSSGKCLVSLYIPHVEFEIKPPGIVYFGVRTAWHNAKQGERWGGNKLSD